MIGLEASSCKRSTNDSEPMQDELLKTIGELTVEPDFGAGAASLSVTERRTLIQPANPGLSMRRQCGLLGLSRSTLHYLPAEVSAEDVALMKTIDRIYT